MIEILILYIIYKREKTIYSIRKDIFEIFGAYTKPSIGTIYPAVKRLLAAKAVSLNERISDGGKKSSYYLITKTGIEYFKKLFFSSQSENPTLFYNQLQTRLGTMSLLSIDERKQFVFETLKRIEMYKFEIENKLNDEFIDLDYYQRQMMEKSLKDLNDLSDFVKQLKVDHAG